MNTNKLKLLFVNNIIKPWTELNIELGQPLLIDTEISDFSYRAINLAASINHFPEQLGFKPKNIFKESIDYKIISDVCDASKHVKLTDQTRNNHLSISAIFEGNNEGKFKFRRNKVNINHATFGIVDFIISTSRAIKYLIKKFDIDLTWDSSIKIFEGKFINQCILFVSKKHHVLIESNKHPLPSSWSPEFVRRNKEGKLEHYDPPEAIISFREKV